MNPIIAMNHSAAMQARDAEPASAPLPRERDLVALHAELCELTTKSAATDFGASLVGLNYAVKCAEYVEMIAQAQEMKSKAIEATYSVIEIAALAALADDPYQPELHQPRPEPLVTARAACHESCPLIGEPGYTPHPVSDEQAEAERDILFEQYLSDHTDAVREMKRGKGL
jgi:hypothetical protein